MQHHLTLFDNRTNFTTLHEQFEIMTTYKTDTICTYENFLCSKYMPTLAMIKKIMINNVFRKQTWTDKK